MKMQSTKINSLFFGKNWWVHLVRGLTLLLFGIVLAVKPSETIKVILLLIGVVFLISGISTVISAFRMPPQGIGRWVIMFTGLLIISIGSILFFKPNIAETAIIILIAAFAFISGALELSIASRLKGSWKRKIVPALTGIISIIFAIIFVTHPGSGLIAIAWLFSFYFITAGIMLIITSFMLRKLSRHAPVTVDITSGSK